jgi:hypothetical protein
MRAYVSAYVHCFIKKNVMEHINSHVACLPPSSCTGVMYSARNALTNKEPGKGRARFPLVFEDSANMQLPLLKQEPWCLSLSLCDRRDSGGHCYWHIASGIAIGTSPYPSVLHGSTRPVHFFFGNSSPDNKVVYPDISQRSSWDLGYLHWPSL